MIAIIIIVGLAVLALFLYFKFFKLLRLKNVIFVDGGLGTGKSFLSVSIAVRQYKKMVRKYKVKRFFLKLFNFGRFKGKWKDLEEPKLYSNMNLRGVPFVHLNKALLFRKDYRFAYKSVVLIDEFSLVADQMLYRDPEINERLSLFFKLFRHETRGGYIIVNSQTTSDLHYSLKYILSDYLYIHSKVNCLAFSVLRVEECSYSADKGQGTVTVNQGDIEDNLRLMFVLNKYFKYYDSYCYSIFTDLLPVYKVVERNAKGSCIKDDRLISFKNFRFLEENLRKEKEKNEKE